MTHGQYYYDNTITFELSYAWNLFEKFSSVLQWILHSKFSFSHCIRVQDDFLFLGPLQSPEYYSTLFAFHVLAKEIGLPIKTEKNSLPNHLINLFGL